MKSPLRTGWVKGFDRRAMLLPTALVATFGWNASAQHNLSTGNIVILEATLVWAGLACYMTGRRLAFALLIIAAAIFKLAPAAFLLLLLVPTHHYRPQWRLFVGSALLLAILVFGPMLIEPISTFTPFWVEIANWTTTGPDNPTVIGFTLALLGALRLSVTGVPHPLLLIWLSHAVVLIAMSARFLQRCYEARDPRQWIMTAVFLYLLLMPRPMAYGFVMLAPVPLYFAPRPCAGPVGRWSLALVLSAQGLFRLTSIVSTSPMVVYAPFLLSFCMWILVLDDASRRVMTSGSNRGTPTIDAENTAGAPLSRTPENALLSA